MAQFTVRRRVDAYAYYTAQVEAESAKEAAQKARANEEDYKWKDEDVATFDARNFTTLDENEDEIEETIVGDL